VLRVLLIVIIGYRYAGRVAMKSKISENGATTLSRMNFSGYVGHYLAECLLLRAVYSSRVVVEIRINVGLVSG